MSDLIKRQDAIDTIVRCSTFTREQLEEIVSKSGLAHYEEGLVDAINAVEDTPSAERTARAIPLKSRSETMIGWDCVCGICGTYTNSEMNYCFKCGAKLEWKNE